MPDPELSVKSRPFRISLADFRALLSARRRVVLRGWAAHLIIILAANANIALSAWLVSLNRDASGDVPFWCWINAILGILLLLLSYVVGPFLLQRQYRKLGLGELELSFRGDRSGFEILRDGARVQMNWAALAEYAETPDQLFFFVNKMQAHILPKRALETQTDIDRILVWLDEAGTLRKGQAATQRDQSRNGD